MANDNLASQQDAMAEGSSPTLPETKEEKEGRKSPYFNAANAILAMVTYTPTGADDKTPMGLMQKWEQDQDVDPEIRDAVLSALSLLATKITTFRDEPRDDVQGGKWYCGVKLDGSRVAFKAASIPSEKSAAYAQYKIVAGPFHTEGGTTWRVTKGLKADDAKVFHRAGTSA